MCSCVYKTNLCTGAHKMSGLLLFLIRVVGHIWTPSLAIGITELIRTCKLSIDVRLVIGPNTQYRPLAWFLTRMNNAHIFKYKKKKGKFFASPRFKITTSTKHFYSHPTPLTNAKYQLEDHLMKIKLLAAFIIIPMYVVSKKKLRELY